ncbi:Hypothetical_protein [Hexamita inflata]|uniref:Hypothetical_protein n=1 Tax=Hexamita inflata TaxID=28002 RepID=A0AA86QWI6_9EUKA|nr:Hypothetical protein HINF_LOCUS48683 [Hexamita inflata]
MKQQVQQGLSAYKTGKETIEKEKAYQNELKRQYYKLLYHDSNVKKNYSQQTCIDFGVKMDATAQESVVVRQKFRRMRSNLIEYNEEQIKQRTKNQRKVKYIQQSDFHLPPISKFSNSYIYKE